MDSYHDAIPSNRRTPGQTLARLAAEAHEDHSAMIVSGRIRGSATPQEHRAQVVRLFWDTRRPGAFIERQPPHVRAALRNLTSGDARTGAAFPDWYAAS
jgi:hypothetical protein